MSPSLRRALVYIIAVGMAALLAEGITYWQGTGHSTAALGWLLFTVKLCGVIVLVVAALDVTGLLFRRRADNNGAE